MAIDADMVERTLDAVEDLELSREEAFDHLRAAGLPERQASERLDAAEYRADMKYASPWEG